jgi:SulP family sulfate permease
VFPDEIKVLDAGDAGIEIGEISPEALWEAMRATPEKITVVDVREPREFQRGHVPGAELVPLTRILTGEHQLVCGGEHQIVLVCRSGRRSRRAAQRITDEQTNVKILKGGMLAWEASGLLEAIDYIESAKESKWDELVTSEK